MEIIEIDSSSDNFTSQETSFQSQDIHDSSQNIQDTSQNIQDTSHEEIYDQIKKVKNPRSMVHDHFTLNIETNRYECSHCDKNYQVAKDGSTSTLRKHLKERHNDLLSITDAMNELEISEKLVYILFYFILLLYLLFISLIYHIHY